jgi:hypothetical protein
LTFFNQITRGSGSKPIFTTKDTKIEPLLVRLCAPSVLSVSSVVSLVELCRSLCFSGGIVQNAASSVVSLAEWCGILASHRHSCFGYRRRSSLRSSG